MDANHEHHGHHHGHGHGHGGHDDSGLYFEKPETAAFAEAEAEVLLDLADQAIAALAAEAVRPGIDVRRIVDVGSGPGVASCLLAQRFTGARVLAADGSAAMLDRARDRAARLGVADRVDTRQARLPDDLASLGPADLVWASMVLHHIGDETDALRAMRGMLVPGGLLGLVEHAQPLRLIPNDPDLGRPGRWSRLDDAAAAWFADMRAGLPGVTASTDPRSMVETAGYEVVADEELSLDVRPPLDDTARRFAHEHVRRSVRMLERYADPADLDPLRRLVGEGDGDPVVGWDDLTIRTTRRLLIARA